MIQQILIKILLSPLSLLYGIGISIRDAFYKFGFLKGVEFNLPVISVGNLSIGGAGKTPHIEYLIRLLKDYINVSTISRGYRRKSKGFIAVEGFHTADHVGDEPLQYKRKFPEIIVTVAESRTFAIPQILIQKEDMHVVLLDDAFQHRAIIPGLNILLTEYNHLFTRDYLLPSGRLREWRSAYQRADFIIISKCPTTISDEERQKRIAEVNPIGNQKIYFSYYGYKNPYFILNRQYQLQLTNDWDILLICAIARTDYLLDYLNQKVASVKILEYEDHHYFSNFDVSNLKVTFERIVSDKKIILTTEKDAMRLELHRDFIIEHQLPIMVLPIEVKFHEGDGKRFDNDVKDYLLNFKA